MKSHVGRLVVLVLLSVSPGARAEKPFFTEEAKTLERGSFSLDLGLGYRDDARDFGIRDRTRQAEIAAMRLSFGLGEIVELQLGGVPLLLLEEGGRETSNSGDFTLGTKVWLLQENRRRPSLSFLYEVKLPNGSDEDGGATDETDFFAFLLLSKSLGSKTRLHANVGLGILGDPSQNQAQNDVFLLRVAWEREISTRHVLGVEGLVSGGPRDRDDPRFLRWVYTRRLGRWAVYGGVGVGSGDDSDDRRVDMGFRKRFSIGSPPSPRPSPPSPPGPSRGGREFGACPEKM